MKTVPVVPVATAATGVGSSSFTANWNAFSGADYYLLDVSLNSSFSSFVGSYQNYVVLSTSQVVSGLTSNTTYYYRVRAVTGSDSDAMAFVNRVYTASGTLSYNEVNATNQLVLDLKSYSIWTKMKAIYPMVGASAAACAQNLVSSSFTGTFNGGWTYASTGVTPNGTSGYMDTGLVPSVSIASQDSMHLSYYVNQNVKIKAFQIGVRGANQIDAFIGARWDSTTNYNEMNTQTNNLKTETNNVQGFLTLSRIISSEFKYYKSGSLYQTTTMTSIALPNTYTVWTGTLNLTGSMLFPDTARNAFASIGDGLTDTEASNFYTAVQAFQTTLSRQV